tara:strand:- start:1053 stop:2600 length:1548 start_codon:yes stop_codon:yes gene_type:complete
MRTTIFLITSLYLLALSIPTVALSASFTQAERDEAYRIAKQRIKQERGSGKLGFSDLPALDRLPPEIADMELVALYLGKTNEHLGDLGTQVEDISLLRGMRTLQVLNLTDTPVSSLAALEDMEVLQKLDASGTRISSLAPLRGKQHLETVDVAKTNISSIRPLEESRQIRMLDLSHTRVRDLSPLRNMAALELLFLRNTPVRDLSPLAGLGIRNLSLSGTRVTDLTPLLSLENLKTLRAGALPSLDVDSLERMQQIAFLWINDNDDVEDLGFLKGHSLMELDVSGTGVDDLSQLSHMENLYALLLDNTPVVDLSPLAQHNLLTSVSINDTAVTDISPLTALPRLSRLKMKNTRVTDLEPLRNVTGLTVEGAEVPAVSEHPKQKFICTGHRAGRATLVRKHLAGEMGGLTQYYQVLSRIKCGDMHNSPLYVLASEHTLSQDLKTMIEEIAELDEGLRLALLNEKNHWRMPLGRKVPETLLDRVEAWQKIDTEPHVTRAIDAFHEELISLGARKFEG